MGPLPVTAQRVREGGSVSGVRLRTVSQQRESGLLPSLAICASEGLYFATVEAADAAEAGEE